MTDRETNTLATRGLEDPFFQLCCCVSVLFWQEIGFGFTYYLCTSYSCGVVLVFLVVAGNSFWCYIRMISHIDPSLNNGVGGIDKTVILGSGCNPNNYGNIPGSTNIVTYDHGSNFTAWGEYQMNCRYTRWLILDSAGQERGRRSVDVRSAEWPGVIESESDWFWAVPLCASVLCSSISGKSPVLKDHSIGNTASSKSGKSWAKSSRESLTKSPTGSPTKSPTKSPAKKPTKKPAKSPRTN